uniref:Uncharacterized protein n=1 Tax=Triticum urartu TaxID=4572 RepID=A0A8R7QEB5_TRIUA
MANDTRCSDLFRPPPWLLSIPPPAPSSPLPHSRLIPKAAPSLSHLIWSGRSLDRARYHTACLGWPEHIVGHLTLWLQQLDVPCETCNI